MTESATSDLAEHRRTLAGTTLAQRFARDADRFAHLSFAWDDSSTCRSSVSRARHATRPSR